MSQFGSVDSSIARLGDEFRGCWGRLCPSEGGAAVLWLTGVTTVACCSATGCAWVELACVTSACTPNVPEDVVLPASAVLESPAILDAPLLLPVPLVDDDVTSNREIVARTLWVGVNAVTCAVADPSDTPLAARMPAITALALGDPRPVTRS